METEKIITNYLDKISEKEILKLRENCKNNRQFHDYLYKTCEKIFRKLAFPYCRFEILSNCVKDVKNNGKYYPKIKKINSIFNKLERICIYMNLAMDEYAKMLDYIEK